MTGKQHTYEKTLPILGEQVRLWRTARKMTQADLEMKAGLSHNTVSRIECGSVSPRIETIERISQSLGVSVEQLQFQSPISSNSGTQVDRSFFEKINELAVMIEKISEPTRSDLLQTFFDLIRITINERNK